MLLRACCVAMLMGKSDGVVLDTFPKPTDCLLRLLMKLVTSENDAKMSVISCCDVFVAVQQNLLRDQPNSLNWVRCFYHT